MGKPIFLQLNEQFSKTGDILFITTIWTGIFTVATYTIVGLVNLYSFRLRGLALLFAFMIVGIFTGLLYGLLIGIISFFTSLTCFFYN